MEKMDRLIVSGTILDSRIMFDDAVEPPKVPPGVPLAGFGAFVQPPTNQRRRRKRVLLVYLALQGEVVNWDRVKVGNEAELESLLRRWAGQYRIPDKRLELTLRDTKLQLRHYSAQ